MKVIPIQGIIVEEPIEICIREFTSSYLEKIYNIKNNTPKDEQDKLYREITKIVDRKHLYRYLGEADIRQVLLMFKDIQTFAIIDRKLNNFGDMYDLRVALSIIYLAYRMKTERVVRYYAEDERFNRKYTFFERFETTGYHSIDDYIKPSHWDVKVGTKKIDGNDFDLNVPTYYTDDDTIESWKIPKYYYQDLRIDKDISQEVDMICLIINKKDKMSIKMRSALNTLFHTLPNKNIDIMVIMYATILETLLVSENEDKPRKKMSARAACLIQNGESLESKEYIASWINRFYEFRNKIIHEGESHVVLRYEDNTMYSFGIPLINHIIFNIITEIVNCKISSIDEIKEIVIFNKDKDGLDNSFKYIKKEIHLIHEE